MWIPLHGDNQVLTGNRAGAGEQMFFVLDESRTVEKDLE